MKNLNKIKEKTKEAGATSVLLSLLFDVNPSTVTGWNSNVTQPTLSVIDDIADFLELPNSELVASKERKQTGLAKATQKELKRLLALDIPHKIRSKGNDGKDIEINNPELVKALRDFVADYKSKNR